MVGDSVAQTPFLVMILFAQHRPTQLMFSNQEVFFFKIDLFKLNFVHYHFVSHRDYYCLIHKIFDHWSIYSETLRSLR